MNRPRPVLAVLALVAMVRPSAQGELSKELQSLQGTWVITTIDGKPVPATAPAMTLVIEGTQYAQTIDGAVTERGEIRLDPSKTPMVMDLFIAAGKDANKAQFGVVRVEGAVITMKLNAPAEPTRPKDFTVAAGHTVFVATKRRLLVVTPVLAEWWEVGGPGPEDLDPIDELATAA